jgi:hypothetical protein
LGGRKREGFRTQREGRVARGRASDSEQKRRAETAPIGKENRWRDGERIKETGGVRRAWLEASVCLGSWGRRDSDDQRKPAQISEEVHIGKRS